MLVLPARNRYCWSAQNQTGRPNAAMGVAVTPGNNTKGSWVQMLSAATVANDVWFIVITINSNAVSAAARDLLVDIGVDPAGGTSYTAFIADLLGSNAAGYASGASGAWYAFPVRIPAGASIAARSSVNNATVGTHDVFVQVYGRPTRPDLQPSGKFVASYGAVAANSRGTLITPGTTLDGSWTEIGSNIAEPLWYFQIGQGLNDSTMTNAAIEYDLGFGTSTANVEVIESGILGVTNSSEIMNMAPWNNPVQAMRHVPAGYDLFIRAQSSAAIDTNHSVMVYGVGG